MRKNKTLTIGNWWICVSWPLIQKTVYPGRTAHTSAAVYTFGFTFRVSRNASPVREVEVFQKTA